MSLKIPLILLSCQRFFSVTSVAKKMNSLIMQLLEKMGAGQNYIFILIETHSMSIIKLIVSGAEDFSTFFILSIPLYPVFLPNVLSEGYS